MNPTSSNIGGWRDSEIRGVLKSIVFDSLPNDLKAVIKEAVKINISVPTYDKLFLLSAIEVTTQIVGFYGMEWGSGTTYEYWRNVPIPGAMPSNGAEVKRDIHGIAHSWHLRSRSVTDTNHFASIGSTGGLWIGVFANSSRGIAPAFGV